MPIMQGQFGIVFNETRNIFTHSVCIGCNCSTLDSHSRVVKAVVSF